MISKFLGSFLVIIIISSVLLSCFGNLVKISKRRQNSSMNKSSRESRFLYSWFFPIPNLIPFPTTARPIMGPGPYCSHMGTEGQCVSEAQCNLFNGGMPTSFACEPGKVCCLIKLTWDDPMRPGELIVAHDFSTLENLGATRTTYLIPRQSQDVCQIKLEFKKFSLSQPERISLSEDDNPGECRMDTTVIAGADNLNPPLTLCGNLEYPNSIEHVYLHYESSQMISLDLNLKRMDSMYRILVRMIKCGSPERAPQGCTQYYTRSTEMVRSFNFPNQQLNNQRYTVCVEANSPTSTASSIKWSTCRVDGADTEEFFISGNAPTYRSDCAQHDKIMIPGSVKGVFCGGVFTTVESSAKPFMLFVDFDKLEVSPIPSPVSPGDNYQCPEDFMCVTVNATIPHNATYCSQDPEVHICELDLSDPDRFPHIKHDMSNTGFCLEYTKM